MQNIKESIAKIKEFIDLWMKFNEIYKEAMKKPTITPEEEKAFLETKSILARKFQTLADSLSIDRSTIERTYDVINQILSLKGISTLSEEGLKRIENDWHNSYISLNRLLGHLEAQKEILSKEGVLTAKGLGSVLKFLLYLVIVAISIFAIGFIVHILGGVK